MHHATNQGLSLFEKIVEAEMVLEGYNHEINYLIPRLSATQINKNNCIKDVEERIMMLQLLKVGLTSDFKQLSVEKRLSLATADKARAEQTIEQLEELAVMPLTGAESRLQLAYAVVRYANRLLTDADRDNRNSAKSLT